MQYWRKGFPRREGYSRNITRLKSISPLLYYRYRQRRLVADVASCQAIARRWHYRRARRRLGESRPLPLITGRAYVAYSRRPPYHAGGDIVSRVLAGDELLARMLP